ncbi:MAG: hypothetical protein JXA62_03235 [Candidatus Aminicenantes bacterium]|nr:hypothetical protein [Candidatus Aminicenantes bacterium]
MKIRLPRLCLFLIMILITTSLHARSTDGVFRVIEISFKDTDSTFVLQSLDPESTTSQRTLTLPPATRIVNLATARTATAAMIQPGDIVFASSNGIPREILFIRPGDRVHPDLDSRQPEEAAGINRLSHALAHAKLTEDPSLEKIRRAFLFILEFATATPFTAEQEKIILQAFTRDWWLQKPPSGKQAFELYPGLVKFILQANETQINELQATLSSAVSEWLDETPANDPVAAAIRTQAALNRQVLASHPAPLYAHTAMAYAEMLDAAARIHREEIPATDSETVTRIRTRLVQQWPSLSATEREQISTAPGIWLTTRAALAFGTPGQRETAIRLLQSLVEKDEPAATRGAKKSRSLKRRLASNMVRHNAMMAIKQQTFKTWLWSRRFH